MNTNPEDLIRWGHDELTRSIDREVAAMPDRTKILVAILVFGSDTDASNAKALEDLGLHIFTTKKLIWMHPVRVIYLGFDSSDAAAYHQLWSVLVTLPRLNEMAIYVDGKPQFIVHRVLIEHPPTDSAFAALRPTDDI